MNKKSFLVFSACAFMLTACGGDSGSNSGSYENLDDIPNCSSKRDGDIYFVEDKNEDYVCADGKWIPLDELGKSSSSEEDELESSESKEKDLESESSSSNDLEGGSSDSKEKDLESDGSSSNDSESSSSSSKEVDSSSSSTLKELTEAVVKNASVMGSATKGPFEFGSPVYIYELLSLIHI